MNMVRFEMFEHMAPIYLDIDKAIGVRGKYSPHDQVDHAVLLFAGRDVELFESMDRVLDTLEASKGKR